LNLLDQLFLGIDWQRITMESAYRRVCGAAHTRRGIDALAQLCRTVLMEDPMSGAAIVFRNRRQQAIKLLVYDGQGFWLCTKRLSSGKFRYWPAAAGGVVSALWAHELHVLLSGGDPAQAKGAPVWRSVSPGRAHAAR